MVGILDSLFERRASVTEGFHVSQQPPGWIDDLFGVETTSGVTVNEDTAMSYAALFACVRILAESEASLPLLLYRRVAGQNGRDGKARATDHPLYPILHQAPNPEMTSLQLREAMMGHLCTWGNAYAEIEIDGAGQVMGLWPLRPDRMTVRREQGALWYYYRLPDKLGANERRLPAWRVLHVAGFGYDGLIGYSPIRLFRDAVGLGVATEEFGARFYANDASPGGVLRHPGVLSDEAHKRLLASWDKRHGGGLSRKHRLAILEEGMEWEAVGIPPEAAQFLATRNFQKREMAMIYRIPPHMLADLERATFSNIEHQGIDFVVHTMRPWLVRWEQALALQLLTAEERRTYYVEHLVDALLRGDTQSRYQAYSVGRQWGWLSANDVRRLENMNPVDGGDEYLVPLNMIPAGSSGQMMSLEDMRGLPRSQTALARNDGMMLPAPAESRSRQSAVFRHRLALSHLPVFRDVAERIIRREANDVGAAANRFSRAGDQAGFLLWVNEFYQEHQGWAIGQMKALAFAYGDQVAAAAGDEVGLTPPGRGLEQGEAREGESWPEVERFVQRYIEAWGSREAFDSQERILAVVRMAVEAGEDWYEALLAELDHWREVRPGEIAGEEAIRINGALSRMVYGLAGITRLVWVAMGDNCPYCNSLNGTVIAIQGAFADQGQEMSPEGAERPLTVYRRVGHPPLHKGCDCMIVAGF